MKKTNLTSERTTRKDPIIAELRERREAYAKRFNYDIRAICKDLKKKEAGFEAQGYRLIRKEL